MKILLVNIDSKIPNLALEKIRMFYSQKGAEIHETTKLLPLPTMFDMAFDKTFVSVIFPENKEIAAQWLLPHRLHTEIGGTGWDISKKLPPEIDAMRPKINWGFTTRGCIRNCQFCFVPKKEGTIKIEGDIYDIWDGIAKEITIMDNNILALPHHFKKICTQIRKERIKVDFNQGLDHRLITEDLANEILNLKHTKEIRFALDHDSLIPSAEKALDILTQNGLKNWESRWYVYVSPQDTFKSVYNRLDFLRKRKQAAYLMRDKSIAGLKLYIAMASWTNFIGAFKMGDLLDVCKKSAKMNQYLPIIKEAQDEK